MDESMTNDDIEYLCDIVKDVFRLSLMVGAEDSYCLAQMAMLDAFKDVPMGEYETEDSETLWVYSKDEDSVSASVEGEDGRVWDADGYSLKVMREEYGWEG